MMKRVVVVTGGTRGLGEAMSRVFKAQDDQVVAVYHGNEDKAQAFHQETQIPVYKWDVSDFDACEKGVNEITKAFGGIHVLVNNAGITRDSMLHKMSYADWDAVLKTNLYSVFNLCRLVIPLMREQRFGRIVNISSINAIKGQKGQVNYSAAKAGILGFTKSLAQEVASYGVTVNAIAPGYSDTEMVRAVPSAILEKIVEEIPVHRLGAPVEIGKLAAFLASEDAGFITGSTFHINGGQLMV